MPGITAAVSRPRLPERRLTRGIALNLFVYSAAPWLFALVLLGVGLWLWRRNDLIARKWVRLQVFLDELQ